MPSKNIGEALHEFQDKYGFLERFEDLEEKGRATAAPFKHIDSFLTTSGISYESRQYLHGLTYMLNKYVDNRLTPEYDAKKVFNLGNLNVMDFVNEYENIIQLRHEIKNPSTPRKPYEGIEVEVLKAAENFAKDYSKPLVDVWADKIRDDKYSLSDLRNITDTISLTRTRKHFVTAAAIHGAMEKIADERSIGWKLNPLNWPRMFREYRYRNEVYSMLEKDKTLFLEIREELSEAQLAPLLDPKMAEDIGKLREAKEAEIKLQQDNPAKEAADKTKFSVNEAAQDHVKGDDVKEPVNNVPTKERNNSINV